MFERLTKVDGHMIVLLPGVLEVEDVEERLRLQLAAKRLPCILLSTTSHTFQQEMDDAQRESAKTGHRIVYVRR